MAHTPKHLELFYRPTCPYCRKVLSWMEAHGVENVVLVNILEEPGAKERLVSEGGRDGKPMYESDDIIAYLGSILPREH